MKKRKEATDDLIDQEATPSKDNKTKQEIRIEKHSRLLAYMEEKRLQQELDSIDGW